MYTTFTTEQEQILLAQKSNEKEILEKLSNSVYITVRRSVAKNISTPIEIIDRLCYDPSLNVTFIANKFSKNKTKREIISIDPCVICDVDEKDYIKVCNSCKKN